MKAAILATLADGPATLSNLQRALGVPSSPAHRRGRLIALLRELTATGRIRVCDTKFRWYELRESA